MTRRIRSALEMEHPEASFSAIKLAEPSCPGWALVECPDGELRLELCDACGFPDDKVAPAVAALTAVEALFGARFGDDANGALEVLERALQRAVVESMLDRIERVEYRDLLDCVQGVLKSISEAAEE